MTRVNIICEGPTEEQFVKRLLAPHLLNHGVVVTARSIGTGTNFARLRRQVILWLKAEKTAWVTTMIDLYAMPDDFPAKTETKNLQPFSKIRILEEAFKAHIDMEELDNWRFIPHYQLHEFEALLFSAPQIMEQVFSIDYKLKPGTFQAIRNQFESPEHINDSPQTAPSKRIKAIVGDYQKPFYGFLIAEEIGLEKIRAECPHFNQWFTLLETLNKGAQS